MQKEQLNKKCNVILMYNQNNRILLSRKKQSVHP